MKVFIFFSSLPGASIQCGCSEDGQLLVSNLQRTRNDHLSNSDIFYAVLYGPLDFEQPPWPSISPTARDFVQQLLTRDPGEATLAMIVT